MATLISTDPLDFAGLVLGTDATNGQQAPTYTLRSTPGEIRRLAITLPKLIHQPLLKAGISSPRDVAGAAIVGNVTIVDVGIAPAFY